ncbi:MAG: HD domain-containing protein [Pseudomonadota bacterium]|nr:HD domain-containing protein [Pseudomonadota bacterium]
MEKTDRLLEVIEDIANGNYSNDIMPLTAAGEPEPFRSIAEAIGMMMVKVEAREYQLSMMIEELELLQKTIKQNAIQVVSAMATALSARDKYTEGHTARVSELSCQVAEALGLSGEEIDFLRLGGILHDIGKIGFPDKLFQAHGARVSSDLVKEIERHPETGWKILKELDFLGPALEYVYCHHERPDGKGYPRHLPDDEIPLGAKILAVADAYDAMTTDRPYQKGKSVAEALEILQKMSGKKWDVKCVEAITEVLDDDLKKEGIEK